uniref:FLYWCH-type domain-containing protein n=1 Tax=Wuchereria bancrofti TaxID=6293 RepID=A0A1I8EH10_WUCBA
MNNNSCVFSASGIDNRNSKCCENIALQKEIHKGISLDDNRWIEDDGVLPRLDENCFRKQQKYVEDCASVQEISSCSNKTDCESSELSASEKYAGTEYRTNNTDGINAVSKVEYSKKDLQEWSRIRNSLWISGQGSVRRGDVILRREWFKVGCFDNEKEMFREQLKGRVSRWKVRKVSTGSKIFYRCNKFKHFGCGYRMYAEIRGRSRIGLYESGLHDHSSRKFKCLKAGARVVVDTKPSSSQQALLDQFIQNATKNAKLNGTLSGITASASSYARLALPQSSNNISCGQDNIFDPKGLVDDNLIPERSVKIFSPKVDCDDGDDTGESNEPLYVLSDGSNLSELLRVANDMDLAFTYNSRRTGEFCFESNAQDMRGRLVVFADLGTKVAVRERFNGSDLSYEEWSKADWKQFLWAVRGKCMNVLRGL